MVIGSIEAASQYSKVKGRLSLKKDRSPSGSVASAAIMGDVDSKPAAVASTPPSCGGKENVEVDAAGTHTSAPAKGNPPKLSKKERELQSLAFTSPGTAWTGQDGSTGSSKRLRRSKVLNDEEAQLAEALRISEEDARRSQEAKQHDELQATCSNPPSARKARAFTDCGDVDPLSSTDREVAVGKERLKAGKKILTSAFESEEEEEGVTSKASQEGATVGQGGSQKSGVSNAVAKKARRRVEEEEEEEDVFQEADCRKDKSRSVKKHKRISYSDDDEDGGRVPIKTSTGPLSVSSGNRRREIEVSDSEEENNDAKARPLASPVTKKKAPRPASGKAVVKGKGHTAMTIDDSDEEVEGASKTGGAGGNSKADEDWCASGGGKEGEKSDDASEGFDSPSESEISESDADDEFDESSEDESSKNKKKGKSADKKGSQVPPPPVKKARSADAKQTPSTRANPRSSAAKKGHCIPTGKSLQQQAIAEKQAAAAAAEKAEARTGSQLGQVQQQQQKQQQQQPAGQEAVAASSSASSGNKDRGAGKVGGGCDPKVQQHQSTAMPKMGGVGGSTVTSLAGSVASAPPRTGLSKFRSSGMSSSPSTLPGNGARRVGLSRPRTSLHKIAPVVHR